MQSRLKNLLEFAVVAFALGVVAWMALERIAQLQEAAGGAADQSRAAQRRSITALHEARGRANPCTQAPAAASSSRTELEGVCP